MSNKKSEIILFRSKDNSIAVQVLIENESVWLTQEQIAKLFEKGRSTISEHIQHIFQEGELEEKMVCRESRHTTQHGAIVGKTQSVLAKYYNLDLIISVGYRVKSFRGTEFRKWATARLREYIIKGFTIDDERMKNAGGGNYWQELLERIRDIRSSEKVLYRQVLDLYATSIDYDPKSKDTVLFFQTVQNKLHYAVNRQTAAELIHNRVDAKKVFMGLTSFSGSIPTKKDVVVAKNYLDKNELFRLNRLVSAFFDLAEIKAQEHIPMKMSDWGKELDTFVKTYGKGVLKHTGVISHEKALKKAQKEYRSYQAKTLSPVEIAYLESLKNLQKKVEKTAK